MNSGIPAPVPRKRKLDLVHLHHLTSVEPATYTGRVVWIWPEIRASLAAGKMLTRFGKPHAAMASRSRKRSSGSGCPTLGDESGAISGNQGLPRTLFA